MTPLEVQLSVVRRRLIIQRFLDVATTALLATAFVACAWVILVRFFPTLGEPLYVTGILLGTGLLAAALQAWQSRPSTLHAALVTDERLGFRERLTSSLQFSAQHGEFVDALHDDAREHLNGINVRRDFPLVLPRKLPYLVIPILLYGLLYVLLPEFDLFGIEERRVEARQVVEKRSAAAERVREEVLPVKAAVKALKVPEVGEALARMEELAEGLERGELTENKVVAELSDLRRELISKRDAKADQLPKPKMASPAMDSPEGREMADALQKQDFGKAAEAMKKLADKLADKNTSQGEKEKIAKDMAALSEMMGMPESALQQALSEGLSDAGKQMKEGNRAQAQEAMAAAQKSLEEMEKLQQELDAMNKASQCAGQCAGGVCQAMGMKRNSWKPGVADLFGDGMGGVGHGRGGDMGELPDVNGQFQEKLLPGELSAGQVLMGMDERVSPEGGEPSQIEMLQGTLEQAQQDAERALEQEEIPRGSQEFVRNYFGSDETTTE